MTEHFLKLALRSFRRHKSSFFINLIGLAAGLASTLLIVLWVTDELQMDGFHRQDNRLYNVMEHQQYADHIMTTHSTPGLLAETLKEEIPEIELATTITWNTAYTLSVGDKNIQARGYHAGADFFRMFSFDLLQGTSESVLRDLNAIALSASTAKSLFGSLEAAMGQSLELNHEEVYQVTGIFADPPANSSYQFDLILNYEKFKNEEGNAWLRSWGSNGPSTKALLVAGADPRQVENKIRDFVRKRNEQSNVTLFLQPFSESYLYGRYEISCLGLFGLAAFTADRKKKEIGIRKVLGASVINIVTLLTRDFTRLVIAAILIGLPTAYFLIVRWLNSFAYRIDLNVWYFLLAGMLVLFISWLTVSSQAFRSAHIDPKECLKEV